MMLKTIASFRDNFKDTDNIALVVANENGNENTFTLAMSPGTQCWQIVEQLRDLADEIEGYKAPPPKAIAQVIYELEETYAVKEMQARQKAVYDGELRGVLSCRFEDDSVIVFTPESASIDWYPAN